MIGQAVADWVTAMWVLSLLAVAWGASVVVARHSGRVAERRRIDRGRARVLSAAEDAAAVTVSIPVQRQGVDP